MWDSLLGRSRVRSPRTPSGVRIYAVGDVHGRADLLAHVFTTIDADIASYPAPRIVEVLLGDYIDRGPQSRQVLDLLIARRRRRHVVCLKGNHETYIADFLRNPSVIDEWRRFGGVATLLSYGIAPAPTPDRKEQRELAMAFGRALPAEHRQFLATLECSFLCGDYFFAHAGIRPTIPIAKQREQDLLWIRDDFLLHENCYSKVIIHGHTPVTKPDIRPNRINIDTGAYATGRLSCLMLEGEDLLFIA